MKNFMMIRINLIFHYTKTHPNFTRNMMGYTDDNKPSIHNAKVPAKFKEDFDFKIPIEMSVYKRKTWAVK